VIIEIEVLTVLCRGTIPFPLLMMNAHVHNVGINALALRVKYVPEENQGCREMEESVFKDRTDS
jgi:hypothetical protein